MIVSWLTEYEAMNCLFTIEVSIDGIQWQTVETISGSGVTSRYTPYVLTIPRYKDYQYYRIRPIGGRSDPSVGPIIDMTLFLAASGEWEGDQLRLDFLANREQEVIIRVFDRVGEQIITKRFDAFSGDVNSCYLDMANFPKGRYLIMFVQALTDMPVRELITDRN